MMPLQLSQASLKPNKLRTKLKTSKDQHPKMPRKKKQPKKNPKL